jgi:hypothetical protein
MPARTILDDALEQTAEDKRRQRDRDFGDKDFEAWARGWMDAKRRGGEDRETEWYANNRRQRR